MQGLIDYKTAKKIINKYPNADEYIIDNIKRYLVRYFLFLVYINWILLV